jgi:hypothetical protein
MNFDHSNSLFAENLKWKIDAEGQNLPRWFFFCFEAMLMMVYDELNRGADKTYNIPAGWSRTDRPCTLN